MNTQERSTLTAQRTDVPISESYTADLVPPEFIVVPTVPGLPQRVMGGELRAALQARAEIGVAARR